MSEIILQGENISTYFPVKRRWPFSKKKFLKAVDGVSFILKKRKTLGLVGESGCGKSTLGRAILRLLEPHSGKIIFDGQDITKLSSRQLQPYRRHMQMIFQDPFSSLNPRMTVKKILEEPFIIHKLFQEKSLRDEKILSLLLEVGLKEDALYRYPHEFSGGQRQRIGIARALALDPQLVICDEPVSALDVSVQAQILNLMSDLQQKYHLAYVFISHNLAVVEHIANDVAVMYLGRFVEYTTAKKLYSEPRHPYTQGLLESIPKPVFTGKKISSPMIRGDLPSPLSPPSGCPFHPRCPKAQAVCREKIPPLENKSAASEEEPHLVACHFA